MNTADSKNKIERKRWSLIALCTAHLGSGWVLAPTINCVNRFSSVYVENLHRTLKSSLFALLGRFHDGIRISFRGFLHLAPTLRSAQTRAKKISQQKEKSTTKRISQNHTWAFLLLFCKWVDRFSFFCARSPAMPGELASSRHEGKRNNNLTEAAERRKNF